MNSVSKLGIVAGGGELPGLLIHSCRQRNIQTYVIALEGQVNDDLPFDTRLRLGAAGRAVQVFKERGIRDIVMIGAVRRPKLLAVRPDLFTAGFVARMMFKSLGDDGLLKAIRKHLEGEGFVLHGLQEFLPELVMKAGVAGMCVPDEKQSNDIHVGISRALDIGRSDIGQAVVVRDGVVIGVEGRDGTNALIRRCTGGILVKMSKPGQDRTLDLPTIGVETVRLCIERGYQGIALEAGSAFLVNADEVRKLADANGFFVIGVSADE